MRKADNWIDYELIDCSDGERLERWGDIILVRPDPQVIWDTPRRNSHWNDRNGRYRRSENGTEICGGVRPVQRGRQPRAYPPADQGYLNQIIR